MDMSISYLGKRRLKNLSTQVPLNVVCSRRRIILGTICREFIRANKHDNVTTTVS
jgi:hypothetical protein